MTDGECRECGVELPGGGYLCDDCDQLEIVEGVVTDAAS